MLRRENGITLVALIITIIILVILAAVSIAAVYKMGIVNYAINGTQDYATASKKEENDMDATVTKIDDTVNHINYILNK